MKEHEFIRQASDTFQWFFREKYITHRDGNVALKLNNGNYLVSASGIDKTNMYLGNFLEVDFLSSKKVNESEELNPSIETQAHIDALSMTNKTVSIHVHSPKTIALFEASIFYQNLNSMENQIKTQWPELFRHTKLGETVPFLDPGSEELHEAIVDSFLLDKPDIIVLQRHGVLSVGNDVQEAMEHIVRLEHVSSILLDIEKCK